MKFGPLPVSDSAGAIAVHGLNLGGTRIRKGSRITPDLAAALAAAGMETIVAARLEPGDVGEDEAADRLARAVAGGHVRVEPPFTGRANLFATRAGLLVVAADAVDRVNAVDETITVATLPAYKPVVAGEMVGTVKIIPYAVPGATLDDAVATVTEPALSVAPWRIGRVGAISTVTSGLKPTVVAKTIAVLADRLKSAGAAIVAEASWPHEAGALTGELARQAAGEAELIVVFGASAIADRRDVIPAAIEAAGGQVDHLGMPVDPGNLLLIGRIGDVPVIGAPGCARSPKENGFDWVLQRLLAGLSVTGRDLTRMGVGGLLMEIVSRGQPRAGGDPEEE